MYLEMYSLKEIPYSRLSLNPYLKIWYKLFPFQTKFHDFLWLSMIFKNFLNFIPDLKTHKYFIKETI